MPFRPTNEDSFLQQFAEQQDDVHDPYLGIQTRNRWTTTTRPTTRHMPREQEVKSSLFSFEQETFQSLGLAVPVQNEDECVGKLVKLENNNGTWKDAENTDLVTTTDDDVVINNDNVHVKCTNEGLRRPYELRVKGVHVDQHILPGFKYRVRILGCNKRYLMKGKALHLLNIGQGYGKRITFESHLHNINTNYFWSDSSDNGFGFSLVAVERGDTYTICNLRRRPIGHAVVEDVDMSQMELNSVVNGKNITKEVSLRMRCRVRYTCEPHGMRSLRAEETIVINGLAVVTKNQGESKALTTLIKNIELMSIGPCLFVKEQ